MVDCSEQRLRAERMDATGLLLPATERALSDLDRVNRALFGLGASQRTLLPRLLGGPVSQALIDVGTGSGDVSDRLAHAAARHGIELRVIGVDRKLSHLLFGRLRGRLRLSVVAAAGALPFRQSSVDWSFSNLFFHHFTKRQNRHILDEMQRVARRGSAVVDLRRTYFARVLSRVCLPLLLVGPVARYDGRMSTDQAWRWDDLISLTTEHPVIELRRRFPFRFSLVLGNRTR